MRCEQFLDRRHLVLHASHDALDAEFAESLTGAGSLQKEGSARLTLTGVNSYGNTFLEEGTLQGDTASIPGA
ncbi:MAG: autotransporter-associated beta strand repeat-containing protein, partial [Phycisphaerales bacterium]